MLSEAGRCCDRRASSLESDRLSSVPSFMLTSGVPGPYLPDRADGLVANKMQAPMCRVPVINTKCTRVALAPLLSFCCDYSLVAWCNNPGQKEVKANDKA